MDARISPSTLAGTIPAVASKSMAHRLLVLQALCDEPCELVLNTTSDDIEATRRCLASLRDALTPETKGSTPFVSPETKGVLPFVSGELDCGESGSTLRFLLPVVCALGIPARFHLHGRLASRPLAPLDAELEAHGARISAHEGVVEVKGTLRGGRFVLPGDVSSQYVSGLLLAAPVLREPVEILVARPVQSRPYVDLTIRALEVFGQTVAADKVIENGVGYERFCIEPAPLRAPARCIVEGDWSNAAFWLAAGALEYDGLTVSGLDLQSPQGDAAILAALSLFGARIARRGNAARATSFDPRAARIDVSAIPDLVPPLAAVAATAPGTTRLCNAGRLRLKESDRLATTCEAICSLGGDAHVEGDDIVIVGVPQLAGGTVDAHNDHRIAMMAAVMATHAAGPTTVVGAECVAKSYPTFWDHYASVGGSVELIGKG